jgi:hypothetical protein
LRDLYHGFGPIDLKRNRHGEIDGGHK